jgi:hypothetical protein
MGRRVRKHHSSCSALSVLPALFVLALFLPKQALAQETVTFSRDVAPIFQAKCQNCHRPGQMAPFSLLTYDDARPWARSIKTKVAKREMPPWFIDRTVGIQKFQNDYSLTDQEIGTIVKWVDSGSLQGNPAHMPPPRVFSAEWGIGKPDQIVAMPKEFTQYAQGYDWWVDFTADTQLSEDRWIKAFEIRPGNARIVHHACLSMKPSVDAPPAAAAAARPPSDEEDEEENQRRAAGEGGAGTASFGCYVPGRSVVVYPDGHGLLLKKGSRIGFNMHYSAIGEQQTDRSSIALLFYPKGVTPKHEVLTTFFQKFPAYSLDIRPNSKTETDAYFQLKKAARIIAYSPHMHMRGAAQTLEAILPTGKVIPLNAVDRYDFNWQIEYVYDENSAPLLPAGTVLHLISVFDNTSGNPRNPDPLKWVGFGQASTDEMSGAFLKWVYLDDAEYKTQVAERRTRTQQQLTNTQQQQ